MELTLKANLRDLFGRQTNKLRQEGLLPAVLYGRGKDALSLQVSARDFKRIFHQAGESRLINLKIEGQADKQVLVHDVARHFMEDVPIHVDFYEVDLARKIRTKVPIHFQGTAPAVKELGGVLIKNFNELEVEALPQDLPPFLEVNIENLKAFNEPVRLGDLKVSEKIKLIGHPEDVISTVQAPRSEEELLELEKPAAAAEKAAIETLAKEPEADKAETAEEPPKAKEKPAGKEPEKSEKKE